MTTGWLGHSADSHRTLSRPMAERRWVRI